MKEKVQRLSIVVLLIAIILLVWDGCSKDAQLSLFKKRVANLNLKAQVFEETIGKDKLRLANQQQIILSQEDAIDNGILMMNDFKNVTSQVSVETRTQIDSVFIPFETIKIDSQVVYQCTDRRFKLVTDEYGIFGLTKQDGVLLDSLYFDGGLSITIGTKSAGFLKKAEPVVEVKYTNPYIKTKSMQNVVIQEDLKWYDKKRNWFGIGIGVGLIGTYLILK
jgi:hypothetical protein